MKIAVLGTGSAGRALAGRLAELGHTVSLGTRDPDVTRARPEHTDLPGVRLATFADAASGAEVVVNATNGAATLDVLAAVGEENLAGTVLVDVANPLDFSAGFPPSLSVKDTDSLGEQVQRAFPVARVVKSLNTMNAALMVHPERIGGGDHTVFVAGDDADAKAVVTGLLTELGHTDVLDLGGLSAARGTEMLLPLWLRIMQALGTAEFQIKVVR
ncbi:NADPH-dependent F420 reductase [Nocardioides mesophilus]|uniref:NAD(P)-binding domain-containing protein n=1 Tax=Nocardioides mesophilus TaxID=433659 RepID=A0A7G9RFQ2_9ACTN|nr:NAD(P)-binding domain-containing protein [Nocardioides mesophilus]QNN54427.1 NAD(P)-binding domain-containing protein [Nocardioides mesophilus]